MLVNTSLIQSLVDAAISSRFDLLMFVVGLIVYILLFAIRSRKQELKDGKTVTSSVQEAQVNINQCASTQLALVLKSTPDSITRNADLSAFLDQHTKYAFTVREVEAILGFSSSHLADKEMADRLLEHIKPTEEWAVLSAFIRFYLDSEQPEKACDIFELNYATFFDADLDASMEWRLLMAATQCGRQSLVQHVLQTSQSEIGKHLVTIQKWWKHAAAKRGESRVAHMGGVLNRLSNLFVERYPFEEHSDDESTCFLGDDSDFEDNDSDIGDDSDFEGNDSDISSGDES
jgi:hypothetical protein